jgi:hypothetical protein
VVVSPFVRRLRLLGLACAALGLAAPTAQALELQIDNRSGKPDGSVYVTLFAGGPFSASFFQNNVPVKLSSVPEVNGTRQVDVNQLVAGRLYVSYGADVNVSVPFDSRTRFDWTEFTVTPSSSDVANLTRVDMFGIPMRLDTIDASGNVLETLSEANADAIFDALRAIPGGRSAVVRGRKHEIVRILSPNKARGYPSLARYVKAMDGQTIALQGRFFGAPQAVWSYSGTFEHDGSITLNGSTNPPDQAPASIPVKGTQLIADISTGGNTPNTAQGAIYRDLLAGFATGLWGGKYGNDDLGFCTNPATDPLGSWCPTGFNKPAFGDARPAPAPYATCEQYAAVINQLSDAYGNPYSDAAKPVQIGLRQPADGGPVAALRLTILPDTGNSRPVQGGNPDCGPLLQELDVPHSVRVRNPRSIVLGTAACPPVCGTVTSTASASLARAARVRRTRRPTVVARDRTQVQAGQKRELTLALTRAGRRLLRRSGRLRTRLQVAVTSPTGYRSSAKRRLTFRARR